MNNIEMLVGTYTRNTDSDGIYTIIEGRAVLAAHCDNPSFIAKHPHGDVLYSVSEVDDYQETNSGAVRSFFRQHNGQLTEMNQQSSVGADPCHITVAKNGAYLLVSNYSGGTLTSFPLDEDGHLEAFISLTQHTGHSVISDRQASAHIHSSLLVEQETGLLVADLGADQFVKYEISALGQINTEHRLTLATPPGAGPRLMVTLVDHVYLLNELNNTVTVHDLADLKQTQTCSTLQPTGAPDSIAAHIEISADGRFLYTSNRGDDSISVFSLEGGLKLLETISSGGQHPRYFALSPDQNWLFVANMLSNHISCFKRDPKSGRLADTDHRINVPSPTCLVFA